MKKFFLAVAILFSHNAYAWDGYDYDKGGYVEIDSGNLVRGGEKIEFYDYDAGEYRYGTVENIDSSYGSSAKVEIYDHTSGEYRTFDME